jgi:hypothetical protein
LVYLALAEEPIEKLADFFFVRLNVGTFSISFASCVVQQILLELPFLRLGELIEELGSIRLWRGIEVGWITKVYWKYDGIMSQSFNIVCRGNLRLLLALVLGFLRGSPLGGGAASVLLPAAHGIYFHLSLVSGSGARGWLRFSRRWLGSCG